MGIIKRINYYSLLIVTFTGLSFMLPFGVPLFAIWLIDFFICYSYINLFLLLKDKNNNIFITMFFLWGVFNFIRGMFVAEDYWEWKNLISNGFSLFIPLFTYIYQEPIIIKKYLFILLKYGILMFPLFFIFSINNDGPGRYLSFLYLYIIFFLILPNKWKLIAILAILISIFYSIEARSGGIRSIVAILIGLLYYYHKSLLYFVRKIYIILILLPFVFFYLGITNRFNVFKVEEYINYDINTDTENLLADTRSMLYKEVIQSSIDNNYVIDGRTPAKGYDTYFFEVDTYSARKLDIKDRNIRSGCEVSILNIYTYTGLIGVILYFFIFLNASFLAIYRSNNSYISFLGIYVIFRWIYAWIEDFNNFDISYITLWLMLSMCISKYFREMTNIEFKNWLLSTLPFRK